MSLIMFAGRLKDIPLGLDRNIFIGKLLSSSARGPSICFLNGPDGSQKSSHKPTSSPLAIAHFKPLLKIIPPSLQAAHTLEAGRLLPPSLSLAIINYLLISIYAYGQFGLEAILQQNFANIAAFLAFIWKIPKPPRS